MKHKINENNWLRILIQKLGTNTVAEFSRKTNINRGLIDKLLADMHSPRMDTLQKIKKVFPEVNMNWIVAGLGEPLEIMPDEQENILLDAYRNEIKTSNDKRKKEAFISALHWAGTDYDELRELEVNIKLNRLQPKKMGSLALELLALQEQRRMTFSVLLGEPKQLSLSPHSQINKKHQRAEESLKELNVQIQKTIYLNEE